MNHNYLHEGVTIMPVIKLTLNEQYYTLLQGWADAEGVSLQEYIRNALFNEKKTIFTPAEAVSRALKKYRPGEAFTLPELYGPEWSIERGVAGVFGRQFFRYVEEEHPGVIKYDKQVNCGRHAQYIVLSNEESHK